MIRIDQQKLPLLIKLKANTLKQFQSIQLIDLSQYKTFPVFYLNFLLDSFNLFCLFASYCFCTADESLDSDCTQVVPRQSCDLVISTSTFNFQNIFCFSFALFEQKRWLSSANPPDFSSHHYANWVEVRLRCWLHFFPTPFD